MSFTYTQSSAEILRNALSDNWSLSDPLAKVPISPVTGVQYVYFFDRAQIVKNEKAKALVVEKIVHEGDENRVVHPKFIEQADIYEITLYLRVTSVNPDQFDVWLLNMDNMAEETLRILKTIYDPTTTTGVFFQTRGVWENQDVYVKGAQPELRRKLRFTLTRIVSTDDEVFLGYGGVLVFDTSASTGDSLPSTDYTFTQVKNAKLREGFQQIPTLTKDTTTNGVGVPFLDRGLFSGTFFAIMYAKKSDILGTTTEKLQNIYKTQTASTLIGQQADVVFLQSATNTETTDSVNLIVVNEGGSGYTSAPTVTISAPTSGTTALAEALIEDDDSIVGFTITENGSGYTSAPTVTISGGSGTGATAVASIAVVLTKQSFMKIIEIEEIDDVEDLVSYRISGQLTRPTVFTETPT